MTLIEARRSLLSSRSYLGYMAYVMTSMSPQNFHSFLRLSYAATSRAAEAAENTE